MALNYRTGTSSQRFRRHLSRKLVSVPRSNDRDTNDIIQVASRTTLSQLIAEHKFVAAIQWVEEHPDEVATWTSKVDTNNNNNNNHFRWHYQSRRRRRPGRRRSWPKDEFVHMDKRFNATEGLQLPIHQVCALLAWNHPDKLALEDLIVTLISIYPEACHQRDMDGVLPLHRILPCRPSIELIVQMIASYPNALEEKGDRSIKDFAVWTSLDDNINNNNDDSYSSQVLDLFHRGQQVLRQTRHEAGLRFLLGVQGLGLNDFTRGDTAATTSNTLLRSAYLRLAFPDLEQVTNKISKDGDASNSVDAATQGTDIQKLEELLRDLLSRNEAYTDVLLNLSQERMIKHKHQHVHESYALKDEIGDLRKHIRELEMILRDHGIDQDGNEYSSPLDTGEMMSVMGMDPEKPSALIKYMETKVTELQDEYEDLEDENEQLTARVEELQSMLNNLERKHIESSVHSSSDIESVRSKVLSMHDADSPGDSSLPALSMHETPASTPDASRDGDDDSSGDHHSDLIEHNKALQSQNGMLTKELEELRKFLGQEKKAKQKLSNCEDAVSSSNLQEVRDLRRQLTEMTEIAFKREQEAHNLEKELRETQRDNQVLREYQEELKESLRFSSVSSVYPQHNVMNEVNNTEGSHCSKEMSSLDDKLKAVDRHSGEQSKDTREDENISSSTPSSNPSVAVSLAHSSIVNSRVDSLLGSEMIASKGSNSVTRSFGNSSSSRTVSIGSATSWTVLSLAQQPAKREGRRQKGVKRLVDMLPEGSNMMESFHDSFDDLAKTFFEDDLNAIFKTAAEFYHDFGNSEGGGNGTRKDGVLDGIPKAKSIDSAKPLMRARKENLRRFSDGGASPLVQLRKIAKRKESPSDTLEQTSLILAADEDLSEIVRRTEGILGRVLPVGLVAALQDAAFQLVTRTHLGRQRNVVANKIIDATLTTYAEGIFGHIIPGSMLLALRSSSQALLDTSQDKDVGMQRMKKRLEQEFLDTLIDTSETKLGRPLPVDLVDSLRTASSSFGNLLHESVGASTEQYSIRIDFHLVDMLLKKAQRMFGRRFPKEILLALREASFVLQSRLEGTAYVGNVGPESEFKKLPTSQGTAELVQAMHRSESALDSSHGQRNRTARSKSFDIAENSNNGHGYASHGGLSRDAISGLFVARNNGLSSEAHMLDSDFRTSSPMESRLTPCEAILEDTNGNGYKMDPLPASKNRLWNNPQEEENDDIKSTGNHSSERSLDYIAVLYCNSSDEGDEKQHRDSKTERHLRSPGHKSKQLVLGKQGNGTSLSVENSNDSQTAYVRGRSPLRVDALSGSGQSIFDGKASEEFGTDDLDAIFKRAAKEVDAAGSANMYSRALSSSSDGSFWSSLQPNVKKESFKNVDEILDSLLSDTEETYGIEIADGVVWALKSAVQQNVSEPALLPVIRALHNDDVINQASVFNEGEIPHDLVEAIRSTSLPPGTICSD
jgi:hypothetical protein